jgi:hypothetical protein
METRRNRNDSFFMAGGTLRGTEAAPAAFRTNGRSLTAAGPRLRLSRYGEGLSRSSRLTRVSSRETAGSRPANASGA